MLTDNIIPAILPKSTADFSEKLSRLPREIKYFHLDVLEEDIWVDPEISFEVHLMVKDPLAIANRWIERSAKRIIVHDIHGFEELRNKAEIGLAVELNIEFKNIFPLLGRVDFIHLMSIDNLGTQGDNFEPIIFDRIKEVRAKFPNIGISIDGGVDDTNYKELFEIGATRLIVGSHFEKLWKQVEKKY